jgi:DNA mismatch repair ATPase MutS
VMKAPAILLVLSQWVVLGVYSKRVTVFHEYISKKKYILDKYARLLHVVAKESLQSPQLAKLSTHAREAEAQVHGLASLVSALNARLNFMTAAVVNSLLMYDLQCVYRLEKWKVDHAPQLETWLDTISEMEVLCSWSTFAFNHPHFTYPKITTGLSISATALGHPLLRPEECVTNDVLIGKNQRIQLITGANMAGKSTFLRTVGVNFVLALAGAPVCAKDFSCSIAHLRSGMRTADSLKDHQSYFYAELDRLKSIMDELRQDKPLLVLLDEILKGTNSTDKLAGSIAMVRQLLPHPCLALIATHDLALGELEKEHPESVKNFCFEANIENDQLSFDYKLKNGLAQKMNATFLMKKMGIIPRD